MKTTTTKHLEVTMSNNKQSSVEWLVGKFSRVLRDTHFSDEQNFNMIKYIEQAKAMHKEEIAQAFDDGEYNYFYSRKTGNDFEDGKEYYNEIFGQENEKI